MPVRDNLIVAEEAKVVDAVVEAYGLYYPGELPRDSKVMSILLIRCGYGAPLRVNDGREGYEIELLGQIGYAFPDFERYFFLLLSLSADGKLDPAFPVMRSVLSNALMRVEWR